MGAVVLREIAMPQVTSDVYTRTERSIVSIMLTCTVYSLLLLPF